jgi:hypothetical protein
MKKAVKLVLLLPVLAIVLTGSRCKEPDPPKPEIKPCFTVENDTFMDPKKPVQFLNCSEKATSYHWYFGDGGESEEANPAHLFSTPGIYDVALSAKNGEYQELLFKRIKVAYPIFKKIRILRMPVMNRQGVPYDPDGSGLDLIASILRAGDHGFTYASPVAYNVALPREFEVTFSLDLNAIWWEFQLNCIHSGSSDTVLQVSRTYDQLIDSSVEHIESDSLEFEIIMESPQ